VPLAWGRVEVIIPYQSPHAARSRRRAQTIRACSAAAPVLDDLAVAEPQIHTVDRDVLAGRGHVEYGPPSACGDRPVRHDESSTSRRTSTQTPCRDAVFAICQNLCSWAGCRPDRLGFTRGFAWLMKSGAKYSYTAS